MKLDVLRILDDLGIPYASGGTHNVVIKCVNPHHQEKKPSMYIQKETGAVYCQGCHTKGHILQLVRNTLELNQFQLITYLEKFANGGVTEEDVTETLHDNFRKRIASSTGALLQAEPSAPDYIPPHREITSNTYLESIRGFTSEEIAYWKMAECTESPYMGWIYIPIYFKEVYRGYFLRCTFANRKLYGKHPRKELLFGYDSANDFSKPLYICEGIFDMIYLRRMSVQSIAILANIITPEQMAYIKKFKNIVIVPDMDENLRGMHLVQSAFQLIYNCDIKIMVLPKKDPAESTLEELFKADLHNIPIQDYVFSERYQAFLLARQKEKESSRKNKFRK